MSAQCTGRVWRYSKHKGSDLLVLLAIADHAKDDGTGAWPSVASIAQKTRLSERNVRYSLKKLEASGELVVERNAGPKGANLYQITLDGCNLCIPAEPAPSTAKSAGVQSLHGCKIPHGGGAIAIAAEPSLEPSDIDNSLSVPPSCRVFHETLSGTKGYDPEHFRPNFFEKVATYAECMDLETVAVTIRDWVKEKRGTKPASEGRILKWLANEKDPDRRFKGQASREAKHVPARAMPAGRGRHV